MRKPKDPKAELGNIFSMVIVFNEVKMKIDVVLAAYYPRGRVAVHAIGLWASIFPRPIIAHWKDLLKVDGKDRDLIDAREILAFNEQDHPLGTHPMTVPMDLLRRLIDYADPSSKPRK